MASSRDNTCEIIASLMKADRTEPEIAEMTGCHVRTVSEWLNEGSQSARWAWQRVPFEFEDFAP